MATLTAVQVSEGSVLLLTGVDGGEGFEELVVDEIARVVGHEMFTVIMSEGDDAGLEVWGPDVDLKAKVRELIDTLVVPA